mmetsp:Transcript_11410/g.29092  ORF Transcript_11410/g.29092 Transcript_11410/m.29092 type:complete len:229 (-) Transcript_11410:2246-2932(-)
MYKKFTWGVRRERSADSYPYSCPYRCPDGSTYGGTHCGSDSDPDNIANSGTDCDTHRGTICDADSVANRCPDCDSDRKSNGCPNCHTNSSAHPSADISGCSWRRWRWRCGDNRWGRRSDDPFSRRSCPCIQAAPGWQSGWCSYVSNCRVEICPRYRLSAAGRGSYRLSSATTNAPVTATISIHATANTASPTSSGTCSICCPTARAWERRGSQHSAGPTATSSAVARG